MLACIGIQVLCILGLWALLWSRNRSRAAGIAARARDLLDGQSRALNDETDLQNPNFRVSPPCDPNIVSTGQRADWFTITVRVLRYLDVTRMLEWGCGISVRV